MFQRVLASLSEERYAIPLEEIKQRHELPDSKYLELQGMQIHYRDVGQGPVLLLLHGMFSSLHTWKDWSDILSKHFRVISLDNPNYGITGPHPKGMYKHMYSDFLNEFTDALGIDTCMVAGNSLGGWMTWDFAARYPHKVSKFILLDAAGFFFIPPVAISSLALPLAGWSASRMKIPRKALYASVRSLYGQPDRIKKEQLECYYDMMMRPGNRASAARVVRYIRNNIGFDTRPLKSITQPALIMWGKQDAWIPVAHAYRFAKAIPNARTVIYDHCGHMPMEEIPEQSAADCLAFLLEK